VPPFAAIGLNEIYNITNNIICLVLIADYLMMPYSLNMKKEEKEYSKELKEKVSAFADFAIAANEAEKKEKRLTNKDKKKKS
jgi:hypothetical protein